MDTSPSDVGTLVWRQGVGDGLSRPVTALDSPLASCPLLPAPSQAISAEEQGSHWPAESC